VGWTAAARRQAQSFDRIAAGYDRLGELSGGDQPTAGWLATVRPAAGRHALDLGCGTGRQAVALAERFDQVDAIDVSGPMIELASARRARQNISYRQADLHEAGEPGSYDFILCVRTLHHVPDLYLALRSIKALLAPGGRLAVIDNYSTGNNILDTLDRLLPLLRPRLRVNAVRLFGMDVTRRGPRTAWELYRLRTRREWLDHRVTDRFFSRAELERCCAELFPGHRLDTLGGPRGIGLVWDAPPS
jgi:ubiquinone/menaquinone biosynthesis C-methylase UbiE